MHFKKALLFPAFLIALTLNVAAVCPGTYFKTVKTQLLSIPIFDYLYDDFDGDGRKDLVGFTGVMTTAGPNNLVFYKRSAGGFDTPPLITSLGSNFDVIYAAPGDINGDGKKDLVMHTGFNPNRLLIVYLNNGNGTFSLSPVTSTVSNEWTVLTGIPADLNNDGKDDIFLRESQPTAYFFHYRLAQADGSFGTQFTIGPNGAKFGITGDINRDGLTDLFIFGDPFFNQPSSVASYLNVGGTFTSGSTLVNFNTPVQAMADVDGNNLSLEGITPLYYTNISTGTKAFSYFSTNPGNSFLKTDKNSLAPGSIEYYGSPQPGRFNDDASNDVLFLGRRNYVVEENNGVGNFTEKIYGPPVSGIAEEFSGDTRLDLVSPRYAILSDNGKSVQAISFLENVCNPVGQTRYVDFDRDGQTDMGAWRAADGAWLWRDASQVNHTFNWGISGDIPVPQDYDGDGQTDYAVFRPSNGAWYVYRSSDAQIFIMQFGASGDKPVASDFDGDGKADLAVFRPSTGNWYVWQSATNSLFAANFGLNGDIPLPMDYDGDLRADLAVFRPSNGTWYEFRSADSSYAIFNFGLTGDKPVPADYDSDGRADIAVFRDGTWYMIRSRDNSFFAIQFGTTGDVPFATNNTERGRGTSLTVYRPGNTFIYDYQILFSSHPEIAGNRIVSGVLPIE